MRIIPQIRTITEVESNKPLKQSFRKAPRDSCSTEKQGGQSLISGALCWVRLRRKSLQEPSVEVCRDSLDWI